jgi:hypothetical protein
MFFVIVQTNVGSFASCSVAFLLATYLPTLKSYNLSIQVCTCLCRSTIWVLMRSLVVGGKSCCYFPLKVKFACPKPILVFKICAYL